MPRSKLRGSLKVTSGIFSTASSIFFGAASIGLIFGTFSPSTPGGIGLRTRLFTAGTGSAIISLIEIQKAEEFFNEGFNEIFNPDNNNGIDYCEE